MATGKTRTGFALLSPALLVMAATLLAPLIALIVMSFWKQTGFEIDRSFTLANYWKLVEPGEGTVWYGIPFRLAYPVPAILMVKSLAMSLVATACVILVSYPMAYFLAFRVTRYKAMWIILLTIPFWTSYLLRVFSWKIMLGFNGAINSGLVSAGIIDKPLDFLLYNPLAVMITLTHSWIAFAVLPIYVSLEKIDRSLLEAAADLGDSRWRRFRRITLPLSMPGTIAATLLVFIPTVGDYVTPTLVGGPGGTMIG
jgi:spermidine/putrescine transport system permease protein